MMGLSLLYDSSEDFCMRPRIQWRLFAMLGTLLLVGCVGPNQLGISSQQWQAMSKAQRHQMLKNYKKLKKTAKKNMQTAYNGPNLQVYLMQGRAMMPPFTQSYTYETVRFKITPGHCRNIRLNSIDTNNHVDMKACYNGLTLALDPSHYDIEKADGSLRFDYNPVWKRGFTYSSVSSTGYVHLQDVNVTIKAIPQKVLIENAETART